MQRKAIFWSASVLLGLVFAVIQFVPSAPVVVPAQLPAEQREAHRLLAFEGIHNFRDLGGYTTIDGRRVRWGALYRSGSLAEASNADLAALEQLDLAYLVDFRSGAEKQEEPNRLPEKPGFQVVEIPILDDGNKAVVGQLVARIESGDFESFDPDAFMIEANRQFASQFTPEFSRFIRQVLAADGEPVAWHCTAGKDRTGFASAILLRLLGVPFDSVLRDYMASREHALAARNGQLLLLRLFKGREVADKLAVMLGVDAAWLQAAFDEIDTHWGSFDNYVQHGLALSAEELERLQALLLES